MVGVDVVSLNEMVPLQVTCYWFSGVYVMFQKCIVRFGGVDYLFLNTFILNDF